MSVSDGPRDFNIFAKRLGLENEHIVSRRDRADVTPIDETACRIEVREQLPVC